MKRREFIALIGGAAAAYPSVGRAQQVKATIGILDPGVPREFVAFTHGMRNLGYVEGQNVTYVWRSADGKGNAIRRLAAELVALKVDIIVTLAPLPSRAVKEATSAIPIVFITGDAIAWGIVSNLARPGGNLTGLSFSNAALSAMRLQLLHDMMPQLQRVAVFDDLNGPPGSLSDSLQATEAVGRRLGLELQVYTWPEIESWEPFYVSATIGRWDAIDFLSSPLYNAKGKLLAALASKYRMPAIYESSEYVRAGCLMSYGPSFPDLLRRAATYVDKIIKGAIPGDLPVGQPTKLELVINLGTAKTLGLTVPPALLARAGEVIE
jgi:putative tryptophan/tyrosine transport system substrate-binding protein